MKNFWQRRATNIKQGPPKDKDTFPCELCKGNVYIWFYGQGQRFLCVDCCNEGLTLPNRTPYIVDVFTRDTIDEKKAKEAR